VTYPGFSFDMSRFSRGNPMMKLALTASTLSLLVLLEGCVTQPYGPTVPVMPPKGKSFSDFQREDAECQDYAHSQVAGQAQAANNRAVRDTVIGAALGTAVGAAFDHGNGAGPGAATGAVVGAGFAANDSAYSQVSLQGHFNLAYAQCMSAKGNDVAAPPRRGYRRHRYYGDMPPPPPPE
jgi:hypothetical protein